MTAWFVILWRLAATYVRAKHIRAEMLNSNNIQKKMQFLGIRSLHPTPKLLYKNYQKLI